MSALPNFGTIPYPTAVPSNQQVVIPQITIPQPYQYTPPMVQGPQLNKVQGMDGAKRFQTVANAMYALFDEDDDVFYVKVTDKNNYPTTLKRYRFFEEEPIVSDTNNAVTKEDYTLLQKEIDTLKEEIQLLKEGNGNAKQSVRAKANKSGNAAAIDVEYSAE